MLTNLKWLVLGVLSLAALTMIQIARAADADPAADAKAELKTTIKAGIDLLKDKKTTEFLERLMMPEVIEKLKSSGEFDRIAAGFKEDKAPALQKLFEALQDQEPKLSEDNTVATYEVPKREGDAHEKAFHFRKVKDKWYVNEK